MILIGINDSHDSSACLVINGKLFGAVQEERFRRKKGISGFPKKSVEYLLKEYNIKKSDISQVCVATKKLHPLNLWNLNADFKVADWLKFHNDFYYEKIYNKKKIKLKDVFKNYKRPYKTGYDLKNITFSTSDETSKNVYKVIHNLRLNTISKYFKIATNKISFHDHHTCHALYGYYTNPFKNKNQIIVTVDGGGDGINTSITQVKNHKFKVIKRINNNLLAIIYKNITLLLGMIPLRHVYKVMGLAPYAHPEITNKVFKFFKKTFYIKGLNFKKSEKMKDQFFYFKKNLEIFRFDNIAGGVQLYCENILIQLFKNIYKKTNFKNYVFSGGVANNIKASKVIAEQSFISNFWVPPGPGDESISIGAAYDHIHKKIGEKESFKYIERPQNAYWGPSISEDEITKFSKNKLIRKYFVQVNDKNFKETADLINKGGIIFVCFSRQEFGQRALGHRSIICDPSNEEIVKKINSTIKMRDFWMPFTPSILEEDIGKYAVNNKKLNMEFMTSCLDSTNLGRNHLKAAIHPYDNTIRPQLVNNKTCLSYYNLIKSFKRVSKIGAVLNTSLNMHEFPIVTKPSEIINEIIKKNNKPNFHILIENHLFKLKQFTK